MQYNGIHTWSTWKKNRLPEGRIIGFLDARILTPSLIHSTAGGGKPSVLQFRVAGSLRRTVTSTGCSMITGALSCWPSATIGLSSELKTSRLTSSGEAYGWSLVRLVIRLLADQHERYAVLARHAVAIFRRMKRDSLRELKRSWSRMYTHTHTDESMEYTPVQKKLKWWTLWKGRCWINLMHRRQWKGKLTRACWI